MENNLEKRAETLPAENERKFTLSDSLKERNLDVRQYRVIRDILYPNAQNDQSILMAIDYCKSRNLDIMKKPIQIVSVWDSSQGRNVDTIWASITEMRITATRTGAYAGCDEVHFGEFITEKIGQKEITYPEYARFTVYRWVKGEKCSFVSKIFWREYFKKGKDKVSPNTMWANSPCYQLEKCAEASALRKAFPEECGGDYISEEAFSGESFENEQKNTKISSENIKFAQKTPELEQKKLESITPEFQQLEYLLNKCETLEYLENIQNSYKSEISDLRENHPNHKVLGLMEEIKNKLIGE